MLFCCLTIIIIQSTIFTFIVDSTQPQTKVEQETKPQIQDQDISFEIRLGIPINLRDKSTGAFFSSAIYRQKSKIPILHYIFPSNHHVGGNEGHSIDRLSTKTNEKIYQTRFDPKEIDALGTYITFNANNPYNPKTKDVGVHLIEEILSTQIKYYKHGIPLGLKQLNQKLIESGLHQEFTKTIGGHFELVVFNEQGERWKIILKPEEMRIANVEINKNFVTIRVQAEIEPLKVEIEKSVSESSSTNKNKKKKSLPLQNTQVVEN